MATTSISDFDGHVVFRLLKKLPPHGDIRDGETGAPIMVAEDPFETIPHTDLINEVVKDKKTGELRTTQRMIRYIPAETSIYADEQSDAANDGKLKPKGIVVKGYSLSVPRTEKNKLEFLLKASYNKSALYRRDGVTPLYEVWNPAEQAEKAITDQIQRADAISEAGKMSVDHLKAYLMSVDDKARPEEIYNADPSILRSKAINLAMQDPEKFMDSLQNPDQRDKYYVKTAIAIGVIQLNSQAGVIRWPGGNIIVQAPSGQTPVEALIFEAKNDTRAQDALNEIRNKVISQVGKLSIDDIINNPIELPSIDAPSPVDPGNKVIPDNKINGIEMTKELKAANLITQDKINILYEDDEGESALMHVKTFQKALETDNDFYQLFKNRLG